MKSQFYVAAVATMMACGAQAQTLTGVKLDTAQATVGQSVTAVVALDNTDNLNCGLRVRWGDGVQQDVKVVDKAALPLTFNHSYAKPGNYTVVIEPGRVTTHLKCGGKNQSAALTVVASAAPAAKTAGPTCPTGWTLVSKSVVKKTGAYTCSAKAGTALPTERQACPSDLSYFENSKKGVLGCKNVS